jgi:hypothetical protein
MEILLALRAVTAKMHAHAAGRYAHGSWYGRYLWKSQFMVRGPVDETVRRFSEQRSAWKPLQQGVFKSEDEVDGVLSNFRDEVQAASRRHF